MFNKMSSIAIALAIALAFMCANMVKAQVATEGLVSYWSFDSDTITGETVEDLWGENSGTIHGDPQISDDGQVNEAIELNGAADYVSIDEPKAIPGGNDTYALEAWFYADMMATAGIIGWGAWGSGGQVNALRLGGADVTGFRHYWWGPDLDFATGDISGAWHHVAAQFDGTTRSIWFNGEQVISDNPAAHNAQVVDVNIGVTNNRKEFFVGRLDEVRVYNRGLSEDEVIQNMNATGLAVTDLQVKLTTTWASIKAQD